MLLLDTKLPKCYCWIQSWPPKGSVGDFVLNRTNLAWLSKQKDCYGVKQKQKQGPKLSFWQKSPIVRLFTRKAILSLTDLILWQRHQVPDSSCTDTYTFLVCTPPSLSPKGFLLHSHTHSPDKTAQHFDSSNKLSALAYHFGSNQQLLY